MQKLELEEIVGEIGGGRKDRRTIVKMEVLVGRTREPPVRTAYSILDFYFSYVLHDVVLDFFTN